MIQYIQDKIRNIKYGISNLVQYFPLIWSDRDWDHYFLLEMLEFKIKRMQYTHENYSHSEESERIAADLKEFAYVIKILKDDNITCYYDLHAKKYGELMFINEKEYDNGSISREIVNEKVHNGTYSEEECRLSFIEALKKDNRIKNRYKRKFLHYISKYEEWWD